MRNESNPAWAAWRAEDKRDKKAAGYGMAMLLFILLACFNESRADQTVPVIDGIEDTKWQLV